MSRDARWLFYLLDSFESCCACGRFQASDHYLGEARLWAGRIIGQGCA